METYRRDQLVDDAIQHLKKFVVERRKEMYEPHNAERSVYSNMLVLSHYRNKIVPWFFREGLWACALYSFRDQLEQGVQTIALLPEVKFLYTLLHREFIFKPHPDQPEDFEYGLRSMIDRDILSRTDDDQIQVTSNGESFFSFLCAMFWPFIDSYFVTALALFSLQPDRIVPEKRFLQRTQWLGTTLYAQSRMSFYEACSMDTLSNALDVFELWGVVQRFREDLEGGKKAAFRVVQLVVPFQEENLQSLCDRISRFCKPAPVGANISRKKLIADIPILAKL